MLNISYNSSDFDAADLDKNGTLSTAELLNSGDSFTKYKNGDEFLRVDANRDGKIDWREIMLADQQERKDALNIGFPNADQDGDKLLTLWEVMSKGGAFATYENKGAFAAADTSNDGKLSLQEIMLVEYSTTVASIQANFSNADRNKDQQLDRQEMIAAGSNFQDHLTREKFNALDNSGDGFVTLEEYAFSMIDATPFLAKNLMAIADLNGDGNLTKTEEKKVSGLQRFTKYTDPVGKIFIRLVKMVVVPLILASLILGAANLGDIRKLGSIGLKAFGFFMLTTAVAVSIGVGAANLFRPGDGLPEDKKTELLTQFKKTADAKVEKATSGPQKGQLEKIMDIVVNMVPTNPIQSLANGDMLAIIFFALFVGLCLTMIPPDRAQPFIAVMDGLNEVVLKMVMLAMETAPYGVFALIVGVVADMGIDILLPLLKYGAVVVGALLLHVAITHFSFISFYLKLNPLKFLRAIKEAILLGFSTSSSSATLPISMNVAESNLNVSKEVSSFVLPLGATVNMDGTALYQGVAAIFIAQVYGIELGFTDQLIMVLTATLASIGAAGVPGAGMITLAVVLGTAGIPLEGIALIFGLDRILDMFRTTINITGDITCAAVMAKSSGEDVKILEDKDMIPG